MAEEAWRPLGMDDDERAGKYDALHDGVPDWMAPSFWEWVRGRVAYGERSTIGYGGGVTHYYWSADKAREIERVLRYPVGYYNSDLDDGLAHLRAATVKAGKEIPLADFLLTGRNPNAETLAKVLREAGSAWKVGLRAGKRGLVRRMPESVQENADAVIHSAGKAGRTLARAWAAAFGVTPNPSDAYRLAVRAVEHAAVPLVVPRQTGATLGHVIGQLKQDGDWGLPLSREDPEAPTTETVLRLIQGLWKGHHDRHGDGDDATPDNVNQQEAEAAVTIAVPLVQWFTSGLAARR